MVYGKLPSGKIFHTCDAIKFFTQLGFESFLVDMPKNCYFDYVREFYANLLTDKFGNYISFMRDKKIMLSVPVLNSILRIEYPSYVSVYTKKEHKMLDDFSTLNQLRVLRDIPRLLEFYKPTTSIIPPITHVLLMICVANICPKL